MMPVWPPQDHCHQDETVNRQLNAADPNCRANSAGAQMWSRERIVQITGPHRGAYAADNRNKGRFNRNAEIERGGRDR